MKNNNFYTKNRVLIQSTRNSICWDLYTSPFSLNFNGFSKIMDYLLSLPEEAFKTPKNWKNKWICSFSPIFSLIMLNKDYLKENIDEMVIALSYILENKDNLEEYKLNSYKKDEKLSHNPIIKDKINSIFEKFKKHWEKNQTYCRFKILERDGFKCVLCGRSPPEVELQIDHWMPKSKGGENHFNNYVTMCRECNISKSNHIPKNNIKEVVKDE